MPRARDISKFRIPLLALGAATLIWCLHLASDHFQQLGSISGHTVTATEGPSLITRSLRPSYPYSVISGGAYSPSELQFEHAKDAVVRAHYADFDVRRAKLVTLTDDRYQYASYRVKDQIYWTKKRLRIPRGELLLTDGTNYARARCGNRLSSVPNNRTGPNEPDTAVLSMPTATLDMLPKMALSTPPALGDIPGTDVVPINSQIGGGLPSTAAENSNLHQTVSQAPALPDSPLLSGFPSASPSAPVFATGSSGSAPAPSGSPGHSGTPSGTTTILPTTPTQPDAPNSPIAPIPPATPPAPLTPNQPPDPTAIPEPNTVYLFLLTLVISVFALLRITPKDEAD